VFPCPICGDYKPRGGFLFSENQIGSSCFNCTEANSVYEEFSGKLPFKFRRILNGLGFDDSDIDAVIGSHFFNKSAEASEITLESLQKINTVAPPTKLPDGTFQIGHDGFVEQQVPLVEYLIERKIDLDRYKFFFSVEDRFKNRVIIPYYRQGKLIYWQARDITGKAKDRYLNAPVSRDAVMFNIDLLNHLSSLPIFVTEGVFDAIPVNGICILSSKLSDAKRQLLSTTRRRLIFVIDKDANGFKLGTEALERGWDITFAPVGTDDINHSIQRFGISWTVHQLMMHIPKNNSSAQLALNLNCRG
jgi:hypothetical protein